MRCHLPHCRDEAGQLHPTHGIPLCTSCHSLVERFGRLVTLGDLVSLILLAIRQFGPNDVKQAIEQIEAANR